MGATHASHGLAREGPPRIVSRQLPAQLYLRRPPGRAFLLDALRHS